MVGAAVGGVSRDLQIAGRVGAAVMALSFYAAATAALAQPPLTLSPAHWLSHPTATALDYGVFHFRKTYVAGPTPPPSLPIYVSADNRYKLYVNGRLVSLGPTRGDLLHWRYERVDLGPYLRPGRNVVGATVWNMGEHRPAAQVTLSTAFWLQAVDSAGEPLPEHPLNTDDTWEVYHDLAYSPELNGDMVRRTYAVVGPTDVVDAARYPWGWETGTDTASWVLVKAGPLAKGYGYGTDGGRYLVPSEQAPQRSDTTDWGRVRRVTGDTTVAGFALAVDSGGRLAQLTVPPDTELRLLLDHGALTAGYPALATSGGAGATVDVSYAEALFDAGGRKGHRDSIRGKRLTGFTDRYSLDGGEDRRFEPLWWRTWRYVEVHVRTAAEGVTLGSFAARRTGYPLRRMATLDTDVPWLRDVWDVGWRTQELCAHETFVDCPYYEQLQYAGDTRIQALVTLYNTGDATLMRRAIRDFADSRLPSGLTQSRYPTDRLQVIPPYSLAWVAMVHDYHLHVPDEAFVREQLDGVRAALAWHRRHLNTRGLMGRTRWWNFVDWAADWPWDSDAREGGVPPQLDDGSSLVLTGQYAYTLRLAAKLFATLGEDGEAAAYRAQATQLLQAMEATRVPATGLLPDAPGLNSYSEHAQVMGALAGGAACPAICRSQDATPTTLYYDFYKAEALRLNPGGDTISYLSLLRPWRTMLSLGLSTFAEKPEPTRSDCHAWSASPNYHLLSLVAGVTPGSPGFATVDIAPRLGGLRRFGATVPHPAGEVRVRYERVGAEGLRAEVVLPEGVTGVLRWGGEERGLSAGNSAYVLP